MDDGPTPMMDALVEFVGALKATALPPAVVEADRRCFTDWPGTAVRGAAEPLADALAFVAGFEVEMLLDLPALPDVADLAALTAR